MEVIVYMKKSLKNCWKRLVSVILASIFVISMMPESVFASKDYDLISFRFVNSTMRDEFTSGETFDLSVVAETRMGYTDFPECDSDKVISYKWQINQPDATGIAIKQETTQPSKCTVYLSNSVNPGKYTISVIYSYVDENGVVQTNEGETNNGKKLEYSFTVSDEQYYIECDMPDNFLLGDTVTIRPLLFKIVNGVKNLCENTGSFEIDIDTLGDLDIKDNDDGSFNITRKTLDSIGFYIKNIDYNVSKFMTIDELNVSFLGNYKYDRKNDVILSLDLSAIDGKFDEIKIVHGKYSGNRELIGEYKREDCSISEDDILKLTIPKKKIDDAIGNDKYYHYDVSAFVKRNGIEVSDGPICYIDCEKEDDSVFDIKNDVLLNEPVSVDKMQSIKETNVDGTTAKSMVYTIDSIEELDNTIFQIDETNTGWTYTASNTGKSKLKLTYHYYEGREKIVKNQVTEIIVRNIKHSIRYSWENEDLANQIYLGGTYDYRLIYTDDSYDSQGQFHQDANANVSFSCKLNNNYYDNVIAQAVLEGKNTVRLHIDKKCNQGAYISVDIKAVDGKDGTVTTDSLDLLWGETEYYCNFNYLDNTEYNDNIKRVIPQIIEYSNENPNGKIITSDYDISLDYNKSDVSVTKCDDGSYIAKRQKGAERWTVWVSFICKYKGNDSSKDINSSIQFNQIEEIPGSEQKTNELYKSESMSLFDSNTYGLNIYWKSRGYKPRKAIISVDGTDEHSWEVPLVNDYENSYWGQLNEYKCTVKLNSGELANNIHVRLINEDETVIDDFSTSLVSYAQKLLSDSNSDFEKYKPLVKAVLNYGAASQNYFNYNIKNIANTVLSEDDKKVSSVPELEIAKYDTDIKWSDRKWVFREDQIKGVHYVGSSLLLKEPIGIRSYFTFDNDKEMQNCHFTVNNKQVELQKENDKYYCDMYVTNNFFKKERLTIRNLSGQETTIRYSPMTYIAKAYRKGDIDPRLKTLIDSLYWMEIEKSKLS